MLSKKSYGMVVKGLDHFRKQHEEDRKENPGRTPIGWGCSLRRMIRRVVTENHEHLPNKGEDAVLNYLCEKGLLVAFLGDYTFPQKEPLPTEKEVREQVGKILETLKE